MENLRQLKRLQETKAASLNIIKLKHAEKNRQKIMRNIML